MVRVELACRKTERVRFIPQDEIALPDTIAGGCSPFRWKVSVAAHTKLGVVPDQAFALDITRADGDVTRAFFFLEADRGTMPVIRKGLSQTSMHRKFLAYEATWSQAIHRKRFGFHRFRVLSVTKSAERRNSLVEACSRLRSGHGLFLFTDIGTLKAHGNILTMPWNTGRQGEQNRLLD